MKRSLFIALFFSSASAVAQVSPGGKFLAGSFYYSMDKVPQNGNQSSSYQSFTLAPSVGFLVNEKWAVGPVVSYQFTRYENTSGLSSSVSGLRRGEVGFFGRRYAKLGEHFYFFVNSQVGYGRQHNESTVNNGGVETKGSSNANLITLSVRPGFTYFITPKWTLDGGLGGIGYTFNRNVTHDTSTHSFSGNLTTVSISLSRFF